MLIGALLAIPTAAKAPQSNNEETNIINPPYGPPKPIDTSLRAPRTPSPTTVPSGRHYSKEEVIQLIKDYSARYGISPNLPLAIAKCESGYNHLAKNRNSTASGVFQYLTGTWAGTDEGRAGLSVFDADANVRAAIKYIASRGHAQPWNASKSCWSKQS